MRFNVDPPELNRASEKFTQLAGDYNTVYNRLLNTASTMGEAYKAADNLAFVDQINGFCDDLAAMVAHLNQASDALKKQATMYTEQSEHNTTTVRTLAN